MKLKIIITFLFTIGLFLIPFNKVEVLPFLGEFRNESSIVFFLLAFFVLIIYYWLSGKIHLPFKNNLFQLVLMFIIWCLLSTVFNFFDIRFYYFKQTDGITRFIKQYISLIISGLVCFNLYWFVLKDKRNDEILKYIRKIFLYSLIFASIYGSLEIFVSYFKINFFTPLFNLLSHLPFLNNNIYNTGRISSVSQEPPFLAIYLITIASWMFSYIITSKSKFRFLPTIAIIVLTFFSGSRTALAIVSIQFIIFIYFLYSIFGYKKLIFNSFKIAFFCLAIGFVIFGSKFYDAINEKVKSLNFVENMTSSISNKSRFGMQYTSLLVFSENPILGVGLGQQAFVAKDKYPDWATEDNYEFEHYYLNENNTSFPPSFNLYTRILAELGIIGFIIFVYLEFLIIKNTLTLLKKDNTFLGKVLAINLLISFIGLFINWLQFDSFRIYGVWIFIAILIIYQKNYEQNSRINSSL
ncbi:oligosaccharide repeat unit polymerase [Flavobacterium agricola]|uniref:Oligosaccharide repeat unit polymerase n=1 Tax=Flavobacterium agricola TaxID=2870839 RepID=A0ABY6LYA1_9FLAO|nr:O-antigen polymerase [Flavobacterium agricola]UYW00962.1 oligosaccharide repeat unit polymerase [Flavobacterium agricola]